MTGAARGLGNEFCRAFVQSGCTSLAIVDLKEEEAEQAAVELVKAACGQYPPFRLPSAARSTTSAAAASSSHAIRRPARQRRFADKV